METNSSNLMASMLIGTIGMGIFMYGKKQQRIPQLIAGLVLMAYPYLVDDASWMFGIGAGIVAALFFAVRYGL
jgi:hypothetical protein